jgi:hypothetical protein
MMMIRDGKRFDTIIRIATRDKIHMCECFYIIEKHEKVL